MGAGSSTEQQSPEPPPAEDTTPAEPESRGGSPSAEAAPCTTEDPAIAAEDPAAKLLQKNGQLSTLNGIAEQGELNLHEGDLSGQEEAEVILPEVGQRESENVSEKDSAKDMAAVSEAVEEVSRQGQEGAPEVIPHVASSESNLEELAPPTEAQSNDVGFKKVFKFVGFKFTVKKDKTDKTDAVQLLTVKKEEGDGTGGSIGAGDHQEPSCESGEVTCKEGELQQPTEKPEDSQVPEQSDGAPPPPEAGQAAEEDKEQGEEKQEKDASKSPESPTSPVAGETASPFRKFFTQGWAGWRKKTSFRKPKEDEADAAEKRKEQEAERSEAEGSGLPPGGPDERPAASEPAPAGSAAEARLSADYEKVELPLDEQVDGAAAERAAPLATEVFDDKEEGPQEVVAEVHVGSAAAQQSGQPEPPEAAEPSPAPDAGSQPAEPAQEPAKGTDVCPPDGDQPPPPPEPSPEDKAPSKPSEGILSEADVLASQEKAKAQGSPLKKLFSSTGLKKLSGKKQKGKRGGDEEAGDQGQAPADSPDSADEQRGESSASSPDEPEDVIRVEKGPAEGHQEGDAEEGAASDGEKKREGVTPWASFKKMVTPKKRVRRLSESDKEDELDKVKSATLSSTESAASELQEEVRGSAEEPKVEEPKRKVDTSVSWEALICVGSSKKRARKASSSDEEGAPRTTGGDGQRAEEAGKEAGSEAIPAGSQERDQAAGSSSPEPAGSPTEGEGVSTWESFKRLVTARKKSKSKLEEKNEDCALEHSASDAEPGKEESWVSIKKLIPGRRKKRPDGKHEQATAEDAGPADATAEDDPDVPAVVPLAEYDAVEREKMEAQTSLAEPEPEPAEPGKSLVHTVAVTSVEERSPSWISTSVTGPLEPAEEEAAAPAAEGLETKVTKEEGPEAPEAVPESPAAHDDTVVGTKELTPGAMETTEMPAAEEATEASGAEETTEMVSAVSQLTDSPDTTEEATPVQEVEGVALDVEDQQRRTHAVLQAAAEKVREESGLLDTSAPQDTVLTLQKVASKILEKVEEAEEDSAEVELKTEVHAEPEGHPQGTEELTVQTTPESSEESPGVTESVGSSEPFSTCQAEAIAEEKLQEIAMEQAVPRDSPETFTDSETDGSTPVAEPEAPDATGQVHVMELPEVTPGTQSEVAEAEAEPEQKERPPTPPTLESQEENKETAEVAKHSEEKISVETVPVQSWTEVTQDVGQFADEIKDKGGEVPAETDIAAGQEKTPEVAVQEEVVKGAGCPKDDESHLWAHASTEEREMEVEAESEKSGGEVSEERPDPKTAERTSAGCSKQLVQAGDAAVTDEEKEVSSGESPACLEQEEAECVEVQVQSSEASLQTLVAAAVEEKVVEETIKILETGETLVSAGAHFELEEKSSGQDDLMAEPGEGAVSTAPEVQTGSVTVTAGAAAEDDVSSEPEGDKSASRKWTLEEAGQQVACEDVTVSVPREEETKAENEILELETESSKLVQNIIQTAVDQFIHTEDTAAETSAADLQAQVHPMTAISQATGQKPEKEDHDSQVCTQEEALVLEATKETELTLGGQVPEEPSRESSEVSETTLAGEVENSSVSGQQPEEVIPASKEEEEGSILAPSVPGDDGCAVLTERTEESRLEPKQVEKSDAVEDPENQISVLAHEDATGDLTKESLGTNGPKLKETQDAPQVQDPEGRAYSDSDQEIKTQRQETQKPESKPEPAESQDAV